MINNFIPFTNFCTKGFVLYIYIYIYIYIYTYKNVREFNDQYSLTGQNFKFNLQPHASTLRIPS